MLGACCGGGFADDSRISLEAVVPAAAGSAGSASSSPAVWLTIGWSFPPDVADPRARGGLPMSGSYVPSRRVIAYCLAMMSLATAVIHFAVAGQHFQEYWLYGVFMMVVAWLQLLWATLAIARPSRLLLA